MKRPRLLSICLLSTLLAVGLLGAVVSPPMADAQVVAPPPSAPLAISSLTPLPADFGTVSIRITTPPNLDVTVENLGAQDLVITQLSLADPRLTLTDLSGNPISSLAPIPKDGTAAFRLTYSPSVAGTLDTTVTVTSNDAFNPSYTFPVKGEAVDVSITVTPAHRLILPNQRLTFSALLSGSSNTAVTWSLDPPTGAGTINQRGIYRSPDTPVTNVRIIATSVADPLTSAEASVRVFSPATTQEDAANLGAGALGSSLVSADLDGDGLIEVISGAPAADVGVAAGAGQVWIRSFDGQGFSQAPVLLTAPVPSTAGAFGTALLLDDVDGDGLDDLIVGEPGAAAGGNVHIFVGFNAGVFAKQGIIAAPGGAVGNQFGTALAAGTFDGSVGRKIAVGAPGTTISGLANAGRVHVINVVDAATDPISLALLPSLQQSAPVASAGARFGQTLAAACFNDCTRLGLTAEATQVNDLAIGAPGATVTTGGIPLTGAGRVFVLTDRPVAGVIRYLDKLTEIHSPAPTSGVRFGATLATGDMTLNAASDLFVAALGQPVTEGAAQPDAGAVFEYLADGFGQLQYFTHLRDAGAAVGQEFGTSLHIAELNGDLLADLTVGSSDPAANGSVTTFFGNGFGDFSRARRFVAPVGGAGDRFGQALTLIDLNGDGARDLLIGAPGTGIGAVGGAGEIHVLIDAPPSPVLAFPQESAVGVIGNTGTRVRLSPGQGSPGGWSVVGGVGIIDSSGTYTPPGALPGPLDSSVMVRMADRATPNQWGLARIRLLGSSSALVAPSVIRSATGQVQIGLPEEGINFGTAVAIVPVGRLIGDPFRSLPSVVGGFRAVNTGIIARLHSYPYDDLPSVPFGALQFYPAQKAERTGWGAQVAYGDFDGDGNVDLAISAPFASSEDASGIQETRPLAQVGFIDIYFLDAEGNLGLFADTQSPSAVRLQMSPFTTDLNGT